MVRGWHSPTIQLTWHSEIQWRASSSLDCPVGYHSIVLTSPTKTHALGGQNIPDEIELVKAYLQPPDVVDDSINPATVLLPLSAHPRGFANLLENWFQLLGRGRASLNILFGLGYALPAFHDNRLVLLLQAAEAYHRSVMPDRRVHPASARNVASPPDIADWLRDKVRHATEPSLRLRLSDLRRRAGPAIRPLLGNVSRLAFRLSEIRTLYAHPGAPAEAPDGNELYELSQKPLKTCSPF